MVQASLSFTRVTSAGDSTSIGTAVLIVSWTELRGKDYADVVHQETHPVIIWIG